MPENNIVEDTAQSAGQMTEDTRQEVQNAIEATSKAIETAPSHVLESSLIAIHATLKEIESAIKHGIDTRTAEEVSGSTSEKVGEAVEPVVEVPARQVKYVRRGLRKVKR